MATKPAPQGVQMSEARLLEVLEDLGSQHERLGQASLDVSKALSAAQATVLRAQGLLLDVAGQPRQPKGDVVAELCANRRRLPGVAEAVLEPPRRASQWSRSRGLLDWGPTPSSTGHDQGPGRSRRRRRGEACPPEQLPEGVLTGEYSSAVELLEEAPRSQRLAVQPWRRQASSDKDGHAGDSRALGDGRAFARTSSRLLRQLPSKDGDGDGAGGGHDDTDGPADDGHTSQSTSESPLAGDMNFTRRNAVLRMQARLGKRGLRSRVTPLQIYKAVSSLGLVRYTPEDIEEWVGVLQKIVSEPCDSASRNSSRRTARLSRAATRLWNGKSQNSLPESGEAARGGAQGILFKDFVDIIFNDGVLGLMELDHHQTMSLAIREVLCSGHANRLVAELTHVRVDDVAAPMDRPDFVSLLEPVVGVVIVLNGIVIGLQAGEVDPEKGMGEWFWANVGFSAFFLVEFLLRLYFTGLSEKCWTLFDATLLLVAVAEIVLEVSVEKLSLRMFSAMRFLRLVRLVRLLRLRYMKELALMVKGLVGGLSTLFWAVVLLFFMIYVIAVMATSTVGVDPGAVPEIGRDELFSSVPKSFFTAFRCFMGDCTNSSGRPIVKLLSDEYGLIFVAGYFASVIFIVFGLFNLIVAIYIENTLNAAKTEGEKSKKQRQRESVRIAQLTRQLLKKFIAAQSLWTTAANGEATKCEVRRAMRASSLHDVGETTVPVSKEMFLCIIQDSSVQRLMDEMDIPPDRASLFDILDADGSGGLEVGELITGLLRVRGEAKKSDIVGTLLAVRCCQDMLREQTERMAVLEARVPTLRVQDASLASAPASRGLRKLARPRASVRHMLD